MSDAEEWQRKIGRKLRLRDLHLIAMVGELGSMAKAAGTLGVTQSAVSQVVAEVEAELGVRLFDRSRRGVEPTIFGRVLISSSNAAFDDLRHGMQEIEDLQNEGSGEIRIGCPETLAASVLPMAIGSFSRRWPRVQLHVETLNGASAVAKLRERSIDLVFARGGPGLDNLAASDEFEIRNLFADRLCVVVGAGSCWAKMKRIELSDLVEAPWIVLPYGWGRDVIPNVYRLHGLPPPCIALRTFSIHLRLHLLATGRYVTALPASVLRLHRKLFALKELPIELPIETYDVAIGTLRNRTLSRVVERFIDATARQFAPMSADK